MSISQIKLINRNGMLSKKMFNKKNFNCEIFPIIQFENVKFSLSTKCFNQKENLNLNKRNRNQFII